jgi:beta-glucoside operon transcriptional antiterminator
MTVQKVLNNNVAIVIDTGGHECVVTGKGIVFNKKAGEKINPDMVEKLFILRERGLAEKLSRIIEEIPVEHLKVCDEIINLSRHRLNGLSDTIYLTLVDHISFAIERHQNNLDLVNSLNLEIKRSYPEEFNAGLAALDIIEKRLGLRLPEDEAGFIAFHLVSAGTSGGGHFEDSLQMTSGIIRIIKESFSGIVLDEGSVSYGRLLLHLKYFSKRVFVNEKHIPSRADHVLLKKLSAECPAESICVERISAYVKETYQYGIKDDEKSYLLLHIHSLLGTH